MNIIEWPIFPPLDMKGAQHT